MFLARHLMPKILRFRAIRHLPILQVLVPEQKMLPANDGRLNLNNYASDSAELESAIKDRPDSIKYLSDNNMTGPEVIKLLQKRT